MSRKRTLDLRSMSPDDLQHLSEAIIQEMQKRLLETARQLAEAFPASRRHRLRKWCARKHDQDIYRQWRIAKDGTKRPDGCGECHRQRGLKQPFTTEFCDPT